MPAGTLARVPPGVVHGFRNASDADMRYLNLHAPGQGFADYMRGLRDGRPIVYDQHDPPEDGGRPTREAVVGGPEPLGEDATLLADIEVIAIAELRHAPGAAPVAAHIRPAHVASYYVLDGELALTLDAGELRAPAGAWVQVPAGLEHFVAAGGDAPVRYLGLHTPGAGAATLRPGVSQRWQPPRPQLTRAIHAPTMHRVSADEDRPAADLGEAGASTRREADRRRTARQHKILMHHPFADKEAVRAAEGPAHERAFEYGSDGERSVARVLAKRLNPGAFVLHDRAIPGRRGNIDHIVVAPSGVWVADAKRYSGRLVIWPPDDGREMLAIRGRDKTHLIDGLARQVELVEAAVAQCATPTPVHGALCFVQTELPAGRRLDVRTLPRGRRGPTCQADQHLDCVGAAG